MYCVVNILFIKLTFRTQLVVIQTSRDIKLYVYWIMCTSVHYATSKLENRPQRNCLEKPFNPFAVIAHLGSKKHIEYSYYNDGAQTYNNTLLVM